MRKVWRLIVIFYILFRYGLDEMAVSYIPSQRFVFFYRRVFFWRNLSVPPGVRLRLALENLGPIFIKFGQMLSTRRDLLPGDIADELSKLQDRVPPFDSNVAVEQITRYLGAPPEELFASFDRIPVASASVAQVHFAKLHNGHEVAVKVLRPEMQKRIGRDIELMYVFAALGEKFWKDGKRLRLSAVVHEFDKSLHDELDLMREAANYSQLRRNFADSETLVVPEIFWDYCSTNVIVMERMYGIPISQIDRLKEAGFDLKKLANDGVEIFLTQVFRDAFFMPTCIRATSSFQLNRPPTASMSRSTWGLSECWTILTRNIFQRIFWLFSGAITKWLPRRTLNPAGLLREPVW